MALAAVFLLIWINAAVGIIGSENNRANLMYAGVLAVGIVGAVIARLRPQEMARAMVAAALAQVLVAAVAVIGGMGYPESPPLEILGVTACSLRCGSDRPFCSGKRRGSKRPRAWRRRSTLGVRVVKERAPSDRPLRRRRAQGNRNISRKDARTATPTRRNQALREQTERLIREAMEKKALTVTQGDAVHEVSPSPAAVKAGSRKPDRVVPLPSVTRRILCDPAENLVALQFHLRLVVTNVVSADLRIAGTRV